jgi:hypothetical protein
MDSEYLKKITRSFEPVPQSIQPKEDSERIFVGDSLGRVGRLEGQINQILPVLGKVAEGVENLTSNVTGLKDDVKDVVSSFATFKEHTAGYGERINNLELFVSYHDIKKTEELEKARLKAEAILEKNRVEAVASLERQRQERVEKRNRILSIVGTAAASFIVALLIYYFELK